MHNVWTRMCLGSCNVCGRQGITFRSALQVRDARSLGSGSLPGTVTPASCNHRQAECLYLYQDRLSAFSWFRIGRYPHICKLPEITRIEVWNAQQLDEPSYSARTSVPGNQQTWRTSANTLTVAAGAAAAPNEMVAQPQTPPALGTCRSTSRKCDTGREHLQRLP